VLFAIFANFVVKASGGCVKTGKIVDSVARCRSVVVKRPVEAA
jgi:hypothetical protein